MLPALQLITPKNSDIRLISIKSNTVKRKNQLFVLFFYYPEDGALVFLHFSTWFIMPCCSFCVWTRVYVSWKLRPRVCEGGLKGCRTMQIKHQPCHIPCMPDVLPPSPGAHPLLLIINNIRKASSSVRPLSRKTQSEMLLKQRIGETDRTEMYMWPTLFETPTSQLFHVPKLHLTTLLGPFSPNAWIMTSWNDFIIFFFPGPLITQTVWNINLHKIPASCILSEKDSSLWLLLEPDCYFYVTLCSWKHLWTEPESLLSIDRPGSGTAESCLYIWPNQSWAEFSSPSRCFTFYNIK